MKRNICALDGRKEKCKKHLLMIKATFALLLSCVCLIIFVASMVLQNAATASKQSIISVSYSKSGASENAIGESAFRELEERHDFLAVHSKQLYFVGSKGSSLAVSYGDVYASVDMASIAFSVSQKLGIKFIDFSKSDTYGYLPVFDGILSKKYNESVIKYGNPIRGKKQVLIAEQFLDIFDISAADILGKQLSIFANNIDLDEIGKGIALDDDNVRGNEISERNIAKNDIYNTDCISIFFDYEVVGVINERYFQEYAKLSNSSGHLENCPDAYIWMSLENLNESYDGKYFPHIASTQGGDFLLTYNSLDINALSMQVVQEGYAFTPVFNYVALVPGMSAAMYTQPFVGEYHYYADLTLSSMKKLNKFLSDYEKYSSANIRGSGILSENAAMNIRLYNGSVIALIILGGLGLLSAAFYTACLVMTARAARETANGNSGASANEKMDIKGFIVDFLGFFRSSLLTALGLLVLSVIFSSVSIFTMQNAGAPYSFFSVVYSFFISLGITAVFLFGIIATQLQRLKKHRHIGMRA